jgi:hypothetical protein
VRRWGGRVAVAFALWLVVAVAAWVLGNEPQPGLLALYVAVGAALLWLYLDVSAGSQLARWPGSREEPVRAPGEDPRWGQLRRVLAQHLDSHEVSDVLQRRLGQLADQRLMVHHGVTRDADPARAATLLGADLVSVIDAAPPYPRLTPDQISRLLQRIEDL